MAKTVSKWMQVQLWFPTEELSESQNTRLREYLKAGIEKSRLYIHRYFYLYEPDPHCFMALELRHPKNYQKLIPIWTQLSRPRLIQHLKFALWGNEHSNGKSWLDVMSAMAQAILYGDLFARMPTRSIPGYQRFNHLIHCIMDMKFGSREAERDLYHKHLDWYPSPPSRRSK